MPTFGDSIQLVCTPFQERKCREPSRVTKKPLEIPIYNGDVRTFAPVLVTGFNRPEFLEEQIQLLLNLQCKIYVSLDIPDRNDCNNHALSRRCISIVENFSEELKAVRISSENLGCYRGVTEGISWGFGYEENLIILEDDVRVNEVFLSYATDMLTNLAKNKVVGSIAGSNFVPQSNITDSGEQVRLSAFTSSWGWATWRDRWEEYLIDVSTFPCLDFTFPENFWSYKSKKYWIKIFKDTKNGKYDAWDYRWLYSNWKRQRLTVVPNANLVLNIGFGAGATHTHNLNLPWWLPSEIQESFEILRTPGLHLRDVLADNWMEENHFRIKIRQQVRAGLSRKFPRFARYYRIIAGRDD